MPMEHYLTGIILTVFGLFFGSFAGAMVWRLRRRQLEQDEAEGYRPTKTSKKEIKMIKNSDVVNDRSVCLHCGHQLAWYDLIPIVSWTLLRGKCRYCHKAIGWTEPLAELGLAAFFGISFFFWPYSFNDIIDVTRFVLWLAAGTSLAVLVIYDIKWFLLPDRITFPLIGLGVIYSAVAVYDNGFGVTGALNVVYACLVLSGLYYMIYVISKHQWVGFGDVKLGLVLALFLADWQLAVLALFLANVIGTLLVLPLLLLGKVTKKTRIPFGPMLIAGWAIAGLFGGYIINWYLSLTLGV
jgi:leader peptidase (prepilin peptidase) / N-methyltransferase